MKEAYEMGKKAFHKGLKAAPVVDKDFIEKYLANTKVGEGISPCKAWLKGWHEENMKALPF